MNHKNFAFSTNAFRRYSFEEAAAAIAKAGFSSIELMCDIPHAWPFDLTQEGVRHLKQVCLANGLSIANLNGFMMCAVKDFHHPSWIEEDRTFRQIRVDYTLKCLALAAELGVATVSTEPGGPLNGQPRPLAMEIFMEELDKAVRFADQIGVTLLIEPEPGLLIETSAQFKDFDAKFGTHRVGLNFDVGHFYCVGEDPIPKIVELRDYIGHFHLEDIPFTREHRHILLGEGAIDIQGVLKQIEDIGYDGFVTVELYPFEETASEIALQSNNYLRKLCNHAWC